MITQLVIYWSTNISNHYKLIEIDLSKQIELENPELKQQIDFIAKLERDDESTMVFLSLKNQRKKLLKTV